MIFQNEETAFVRNLPTHERAPYTQHRERLLSEIQPLSPLEYDLFEQLLSASWNLERYRRIEEQLFQNEPNPLLDEKICKALDRLERYKTHAEHSYHRSLKALKELQTNYALRHSLPESVKTLTTHLVNTAKMHKFFVKPERANTDSKTKSSYVYRDREIFNCNDFPPEE